jgi:hypothetical protein
LVLTALRGEAWTPRALFGLGLVGRHDKPVTRRAGDYLFRHVRKGRPVDRRHPFYGMYYGAQGMFQLGGDYWAKYAAAAYEFLLQRQRPDGSWHGHRNGPGPAYATAMACLTLSVQYRQLPIYQR